MIFITGDTHIPADVQKLSAKRFSQQKILSKNDYLIICGDFGGIWNGDNEEKYWLKWLGDKSFTTLFIDGNHENFELLNEYEVVPFKGGKAHKISDKIYHLMRGQVYKLCEKKIFTLGGAESHDKEYRQVNKNWWRDEVPSQKEYEEAQKNLEQNGRAVDIIISHCAPTKLQRRISPAYPENKLTDFLESIMDSCSYEKWFFGHYHIDLNIDEKHTVVFNKIIEIV